MSESDNDSHSLIDLERLEEVTGGDFELEQELVEVYVEDAHERLADIQAALDEGDIGKVRETAHALKGASGNMGAEAARELAYGMEQAGAEGDASKARELFADLQGVVEKTCEEFDEYIKSKG